MPIVNRILRSYFFVAILTVAALACDATAAESIKTGKVKSVNIAKHEFILTESAGKELVINLGDEEVQINRDGHDGQSELKVNESVCVYCNNDGLGLTALYVLVQAGETKDWTLGDGVFKKHDQQQKQVTYTDDKGRDYTYSSEQVKVYINDMESKLDSIKVGERVLALLPKAGDRRILKNLYVTRK